MGKRKKKFHFTKTWKIITAIVVVLIIFRLLLPSILLHYCNKSLAEMNGYYGHIEDIDVALYRGAYKINNMYLNKVDSAFRESGNLIIMRYNVSNEMPNQVGHDAASFIGFL